MARFGFVFLSLALMLNFAGCKKEVGGTPTADPSAGEVVLMVSERQMSESPEADWRDAGGVLNVKYESGDPQPKAHQKSLAFTGMLRIPLALTSSKSLYRLTEFIVLSASGDQAKPLTSLSSKDVDNLIGDTRYGVNVHIVVTREGNIEPDLRISKNYAAPPSFPIQKEFRSIKIGFTDPSVIITTQDLEGTLRKLKTIASATDKYHEELVSLISKAEAIDTAHLNLLLDAVYFTAADLKRLIQTDEELQKLPYSDETNQLRNLVREKIYIGRSLSRFADSIASAGIAKLKDLSAEGLVSILNRILDEREYISSAFDRALKVAVQKTLPMAADTKLALLAITGKRGFSETSALLALSWFTEDSDRSFATLIGVLKQLESSDASGAVAIGGLKLLDTITLEQAKVLIPLSGSSQVEVTNAVVEMLGSGFSLAAFLTLSEMLSFSDKDTFIIQHILSFPLSAAQASKLIRIGYEKKLEIAKLAIGQVRSISGTDLVAIASQLSFSDKDTLILFTFPNIASLNSSEVILLINLSYEQKLKVGLTGLPKTSDLDGSSLAKIAASLSFGDKDSLILAGLARLKSITADQATTLIDLGYESKLQIATDCSRRISKITAADLSALLRHLDWGSKDLLALSGLDLISSLQIEEIKILVPLCYEQKLAVMKKALPKVKPLSGAQLAEVAALLSWGDKDAVLAFGSAQVKTLTVAEAKQLIAVSYEAKMNTVLTSLSKIPNLTGSQLLELVQLFNWGDKDLVILAGLKVVPTLSVNEAKNLLAASYEQKTAIAKILMTKLGNLSSADVIAIIGSAGDHKLAVAQMGLAKVLTIHASDAIALAGALSWSDKDTIIANALTRIQPMSMAELIAVSKVGYNDDRKLRILMDRYLAVNDLSVSTVLVLMQNVSWSSKDTVAVGFLNTWSSLTTGELIQISQASYEQKVPILMNYFIKTSDRTVASALQVVALMSWSDKDTFLLKAVRLVTDLTTANLPALAKSAYEKEAEILRAGLARLGR